MTTYQQRNRTPSLPETSPLMKIQARMTFNNHNNNTDRKMYGVAPQPSQLWNHTNSAIATPAQQQTVMLLDPECFNMEPETSNTNQHIIARANTVIGEASESPSSSIHHPSPTRTRGNFLPTSSTHSEPTLCLKRDTNKRVRTFPKQLCSLPTTTPTSISASASASASAITAAALCRSFTADPPPLIPTSSTFSSSTSSSDDPSTPVSPPSAGSIPSSIRLSSSSSTIQNNITYIVDSIRHEVRSMMEGTNLLPLTKKNHIRMLTGPSDSTLKVHSVLGIGTFATVTGVSFLPRGNDNDQNDDDDDDNDDHDDDDNSNSIDTKKRSRRHHYYACKSIKKELAQFDEDYDYAEYINAAAQLVYEGHILSSLDHPNIIKIRGLNVDGLRNLPLKTDFLKNNEVGPTTNRMSTVTTSSTVCDLLGRRLFLLTDVLGETLDARINRWDEERHRRQNRRRSLVTFHESERSLLLYHHHHQQNIEKFDVCLQLASAMEYLHSKNIVYRDLKPENIGFDAQDGSLKLFDFGLCCELKPNNQPKATGVIGTMRYMAPEIILDQEYDTTCDIYAYGVVCWELWTHCLPFEAFTPELYEYWVCKRGLRLPDYCHNCCDCDYTKPNKEASNCNTNNKHRHRHQKKQQRHQKQKIMDIIPNDVTVLLSHTWKHKPSDRIRWPNIQEQFHLLKRLEELKLEERELLLSTNR